MTTIQQSRPQGLSAVLDRAVDAMPRRRAADRDLLVAALEWARSHPASSAHDVAGWGEVDLYDEGFLPLAGEGAPLVAEFAPCELAAALGWSTEAAKRLMADALELGTRLPRLWRLVCELAVPAHLARHAAEHTTIWPPRRQRTPTGS
jgi:hypothetical protein